MSHKVAVFVGSLRDESINRKLAEAFIRLAPDTLEFEYVPIDEVPHYDQDLETDPPESVVRLKERIEAADALLFVTPEYNRSVPGVLKNAIDWASRPYGQNSFAGKPAMVSGASIGSISSAVAQQHLRIILAYVDAITMGQPEVYIHFTPDLIDEEGNVRAEDTGEFLRGAIGTFAEWVDAVVGSREQ